jgi:hypothetical protein
MRRPAQMTLPLLGPGERLARSERRPSPGLSAAFAGEAAPFEIFELTSLSLTGGRSYRSASPPLKWIHRAGDSFPVGIFTVPATRILLSHGPKHTERRSTIERGCVLVEMLR